MDAIDELIEHCKKRGKLSPMLDRVYRFHKRNPQVLDFLVLEMRVDRENGWTRTSLGSLWHYSRWVLQRKYRAPGESFVMSNNLFPHYGRIIAILHPDINGFFAMAKCGADSDFGTVIEPVTKNATPGYIRKLRWADGTAIEDGWRPSIPHEPKPVRRRDRVKRYSAEISDFSNFRVSDSAEPCSSCDVNPPRRPAPIVIKGKHYCLWCALEMARDLLVQQ